jgi:hypothetical protein
MLKSLALTALTVLTAWLLIPVFVRFGTFLIKTQYRA